MKKKLFFLSISLSIAFFIFSCKTSDDKEAKNDMNKKPVSQDDMVKRGEFLVTMGGCNDCHSPKTMTAQGPVPDMSKMLSGHPAGDKLPPYDKSMVGAWLLATPDITAMVGPWGISYAANLTPDQSGLGSWTEANFLNAFRTGKHLGMQNQRPIMPPMPWQAIGKLPDEDIKAIFAYLKSIPPVNNVVPAYEPPMAQ